MNLSNLKDLLVLLFFFNTNFIYCQIIENFDALNYSFKNNHWQGDTAKFSITNNALKLNNSSINDTVTIFKKLAKWQEDSIVWEFNIEHQFSASNSNYSMIYLASDNEFKNSLFFKIGESGTADKMKFYINNTSNLIHETNESNFGYNFNYSIKIIKIKEKYEIYIDKKDGNGFIFDSVFQNTTSIENLNYFGILSRHTSSNATKFIYDNILIDYKLYADYTPPTIDSIIIKSDNQLKIIFSEPLQQNPFYKENINSILNINSIDSISNKEYELTFENNFINFNNNQIIVSNIYDTLLNNNENVEINWQMEIYGAADFKSIIFNEILANPTSEIPYEYIEIYNKSDSYIRGESLSLHDKSNYNIFPKVTIKPHQYYILCNLNDTSFFNNYGETIGFENFITLNNTNEELKIFSNNLLIDSLYYTTILPEKSLAYIDINNSCYFNELWFSSEEEKGVSPGVKNEFSNTIKTDIQSVSYISDSSMIKLSLTTQIDTNYSPKINIQDDQLDYFLSFNTREKSLDIIINQELERGAELQFMLDSIYTCYKELIELDFTLILPYIPQQKELIITEILSNTYENQFDYIEIVNNSNRFFNIHDLYINKLNSDGTVYSSILCDSNVFIYPNNHYVFSKNITWFNDYYNDINEDFLFPSNLPSLNNDSNTIFITYKEEIIDIVSYNSNWHFNLITEEKGVSLEKIDYQNNLNSASNWTSSASSNNFGTPTKNNSHFNHNNKHNVKNFSLTSSIFSPDNDGYQDLLEVKYDFSDKENIITATIYNENGALTKELITNETLASEGTIIWDGINDHNQITPVGYYIIIIEIFNLNGKYNIEKIPFVIAKHL